ncbi:MULTISPECIES: signal peptide peptidase SppA [Campylobacter]|uniref:signal peptide peptidase SppA n=1 Tax=Campylobacter TaxID=194 RepID=UPI00138E27A7|nr:MULTISPECIES: signal peptide peptidase SppA [Campylobacter]MDV2490686.1 signal peptide peptidase SppA [Campylobacter sp. TJR-1]
MSVLKFIFSKIGAIFKFVNEYFKSFVFLLIVILIIVNSGKSEIANLTEISLKGAIIDESEILSQIYEAKNDSFIKGVLLNIDSPGGSMAPSVQISDAIKDLASIKPVIAYAIGTMASGSYYSSIWANKIYANRGSFIGSIGVIVQSPNVEELAKKLGVSTQTIKAGKYKEAGTFIRGWNEDEKNELQSLVNRSYEMFYTDVAMARNLDIDKKDIWANARVFLAPDAKSVGLIDDVKSYFEVKSELELLSGVASPSWKQQPIMDKFISNLAKESTNLALKMLFVNEAR